VLEWCDWAADWAERSDPTRHTELIVGFDERDEFGSLPSGGNARKGRAYDPSPARDDA